MGCAVNQCYSTEPSTVTSTEIRTTTVDGDVVTRTIRTTEVIAPETPTARLDPEEDTDPAFLKFFPSVVAKESPTAEPEEDGGGGGGGLSTGALVGIVMGAVAFLVIVIVAAFIIIRHLNKVVAAVSGSKASSGTGPRMRQHHRHDSEDHHHRPRGYSKPTDSEIDTFSVDPSIITPRTGENGNPRHAPPTTDMSGTTPSSFAGNYQAVSTANTHGMTGYFDTVLDPRALNGDTPENPSSNSSNTGATAAPGRSSSAAHRISADSEGTYTQSHARQWSNVSEESDKTAGGGMVVAPYNPSSRMTELEARSIVPELYGSPQGGGLVSPLEDTRRSSAGSSIIGFTASGMPASGMHQRTTRNGSAGAGVGNRGAGEGEFAGLGIVDEEIHGFYGPRDQAAGLRAEDRDRPTSRHSWKRGDDGKR